MDWERQFDGVTLLQKMQDRSLLLQLPLTAKQESDLLAFVTKDEGSVGQDVSTFVIAYFLQVCECFAPGLSH